MLRRRLTRALGPYNSVCRQFLTNSCKAHRRRMKNIFSLALVATISVSAYAQPYKCTISGKTVYQQSPCEGGSTVNISGAGKGDPNSSARRQMMSELRTVDRKNRLEEATRQGRIFVGMSSDDVIKSWGKPDKINKTLTSNNRREQWVYRRGRIGNDDYVYLENGIVTTIQSSD